MKYSRRFAAIAAFALLSSRAFCMPNPAIREIKSPTFAGPAFSLPGGSVDAALALPSPGTLLDVKLTSVANPESSFTVKLGGKVQADAKVTFKLPKKIPIGLYDMCVSFRLPGYSSSDCQPHSVAVVKSFSAPFKFVQITDYHYGDPRAARQFAGVDIKKVRVAALEAANKMKPAFVIFTGDICAYPETYDTDYPAVVDEIVSNLKVPALIIPGNHDLYGLTTAKGKIVTDGVLFWHDFFGPLHRTLDFGRLRIILADTYDWDIYARNHNAEYAITARKPQTYKGTMSPAELEWIKSMISTAGGRKVVIAAHHSPEDFESNPSKMCPDCLKPADFSKFLSDEKIPYYIYGHIHNDKEYTVGPTHFIATTSSGSEVDSKDELWSIRVFNVSKDMKLTSMVVRLFDTPPMK